MSLPIEQVLPQLLTALTSHNRCLLQADPGAGKTTRVPLALLDQAWLAGQRIIMLEPRRLAARNASRFMAGQLGQKPGDIVGHRTRVETRIGPGTRIEVVTEGILVRMLQSDPELSGVGCVILDEFHERNLHSDLALALLLECQQVLREDLRLLVMSATLEHQPLLKLLGDSTPLIRSEGRCFPVTTHYLGGRPDRLDIDALASTLSDISYRETGSLLCFLPGVGEIRRTQSALQRQPLPADLRVLSLYGGLPPAEQDRALQPLKEGRKLVLTTAIAETSVTIQGIRVVIDGGLMRLPRFDPQSGMSRLVTLPVSQAGAEQRRGRAGRLEAGACYRLWSEERQHQLPAQRPAELLSADLASLRLELAQWGTSAEQLNWLNPPPAAHLSQAEDLLIHLGALNQQRQLTPLGEQLLALGAHPRLGAMMVKGTALGMGGLACDLAALLSEARLSGHQADISEHLNALHRGRGGSLEPVRQNARRWRKALTIKDAIIDIEHTGLLLSFAFPDRIAQQRDHSRTRYRLSNGRGAVLSDHDSLCGQPYLVAAELDGQRSDARIYVAAPISLSQILDHHADQLTASDELRWDSEQQRVVCLHQQRLGTLVLQQKPGERRDSGAVANVLLGGIRQLGIQVLPWSDAARTLQARVALLAHYQPSQWPDFSDPALTTNLEQWLLPYLDGCWRLDQLASLDLCGLLLQQLSWEQQKQLDQLAPATLQVPSGSQIRIDYLSRTQPVLAVKLQELFGLIETPAIVRGQQPLLLELLSPARRPIQTTQDLANFWANTYHEVKKDLKGRYPKHPWPDDPFTAAPMRGTKKQHRS